MLVSQGEDSTVSNCVVSIALSAGHDATVGVSGSPMESRQCTTKGQQRVQLFLEKVTHFNFISE